MARRIAEKLTNVGFLLTEADRARFIGIGAPNDGD